MAESRSKPEQFQLRLPPGLRDRIKAYAERQRRSMNEEIVRVLEREYPDQWPLEERLEQISELFSVLSAGTADPRVDSYLQELRETIKGMISGRVVGVDPEVRNAIRHLWEHYEYLESERRTDEVSNEYDEEELRSLEVTGVPEKYTIPAPREASPMSDGLEIGRLLPPRIVADLADSIARADLETAANILRSVSREELERRIEFFNLPLTEQHRLLGEESPDAVTLPSPKGD